MDRFFEEILFAVDGDFFFAFFDDGAEACLGEDTAETSAAARPLKLPWWRILLAVVSGAGAVALFIQAMGVADLSAVYESRR